MLPSEFPPSIPHLPTSDFGLPTPHFSLSLLNHPAFSIMLQIDFKTAILQGIPEELPKPKPYDTSVSHAPVRKDILSKAEKTVFEKRSKVFILCVGWPRIKLRL